MVWIGGEFDGVWMWSVREASLFWTDSSVAEEDGGRFALLLVCELD